MVFGCVSLLSLSTLAPILPTQFSITLVHPNNKPGFINVSCMTVIQSLAVSWLAASVRGIRDI